MRTAESVVMIRWFEVSQDDDIVNAPPRSYQPPSVTT